MLIDNPCNPDFRVLKEARSLVDAGLQVTILAWDRTGQLPSDESNGGIRIRRIGISSRYGKLLGRPRTAFRYWASVFRAATTLRFDAVHAHDLPNLPVGVILSLLRRRPLIYDAHELYWMNRLERRPLIVRLAEKYGERLLVHAATQVITVSDKLGAYYNRVHSRVAIVGNWYDPVTPDRVSGRRLRRRLGIGDETFCLVYAGSLGRERNLQLLIDYAAAYRDTAVVVAGKGGAWEAQLSHASTMLPNVYFLGWQPDPTPLYGLANALYYVLEEHSPYRSISSPNNLFLSIATSIPLITTASGDPGLIIGQSGAGQLLQHATVADLRSAVERLKQPQSSAAAAALLSLRDKYTWGKAAEVLISVYRGLEARTITN